jgi:hypothetical protein
MSKAIIKVIVDGRTYETSPEVGEVKAFAEEIYKIASGIDRLKLQLNDGSILILPIETARRSVFIIMPVK